MRALVDEGHRRRRGRLLDRRARPSHVGALRPPGAEPGRDAGRARRAHRADARARRRLLRGDLGARLPRRRGRGAGQAPRPARSRGPRSWPTRASPARRCAPRSGCWSEGGPVCPQIACRPIVVQIALSDPSPFATAAGVHRGARPAPRGAAGDCTPTRPGAGGPRPTSKRSWARCSTARWWPRAPRTPSSSAARRSASCRRVGRRTDRRHGRPGARPRASRRSSASRW